MIMIHRVHSKAIIMFYCNKHRILFYRIMMIFIKIVKIDLTKKNRFIKRFELADTPIESPFGSIRFIEQLKTTLQTNRCTITQECNIKGKLIEFLSNGC